MKIFNVKSSIWEGKYWQLSRSLWEIILHNLHIHSRSEGWGFSHIALYFVKWKIWRKKVKTNRFFFFLGEVTNWYFGCQVWLTNIKFATKKNVKYIHIILTIKFNSKKNWLKHKILPSPKVKFQLIIACITKILKSIQFDPLNTNDN